MAKIKIGIINGKGIFTGDERQLKDGEYFIKLKGTIPCGLFVMQNGKMVSVCECNGNANNQKQLNLQEIEIQNGCHGKKESVVASEGYDGISKVSYRKPKLEEKDSVKITKNGLTEIKVGKGYDGLDDVTIIVNVEQ